MKFVFILFSLVLSSCSDSQINQCFYNFGYNLGVLTSQEIFTLENQGCCRYQGGIKGYEICLDRLICENGEESSCSR